MTSFRKKESCNQQKVDAEKIVDLKLHAEFV